MSAPDHVRASVRRWTLVLCFVTLVLLPLVSFFGTLLLVSHGKVLVTRNNSDSVDLWTATYAIELLAIIVPIFILRLIIAARLVGKGGDAAAIHWSGAFALVGLSVVYVVVFAYLPYDFASGSPDDGTGMGLLLGLVVPPVGGVLALIGWFVGRRALRAWQRVVRHERRAA